MRCKYLAAGNHCRMWDGQCNGPCSHLKKPEESGAEMPVDTTQDVLRKPKEPKKEFRFENFPQHPKTAIEINTGGEPVTFG